MHTVTHNLNNCTFEVSPEAVDEPGKPCLSVSLFLLPSFPASAYEQVSVFQGIPLFHGASSHHQF